MCNVGAFIIGAGRKQSRALTGIRGFCRAVCRAFRFHVCLFHDVEAEESEQNFGENGTTTVEDSGVRLPLALWAPTRSASRRTGEATALLEQKTDPPGR